MPVNLGVRRFMAQARNSPLLLAALIATLAGSFLGALMLALAGIAGASTGFDQFLGTVAAVGIFGSLIGFPVVLVYGMPIFSLMSRLGYANRATAIVFGALPGLLWVIWTRSGWLNPALWNGVLIALFYLSLRRGHIAA